MKRLIGVLVVAACAAATLTALGGAAPAVGTKACADRQGGDDAAEAARRHQVAESLIVGVKCDAPPFGYINVQGQNAGFDVEIARWFARYAFGRAQRVVRVRADSHTRAVADEWPRRSRHLDVHVHA